MRAGPRYDPAKGGRGQSELGVRVECALVQRNRLRQFARDQHILVQRTIEVRIGLQIQLIGSLVVGRHGRRTLGFGWHPNGNASLAVRGGYGMYYTQIQSNLVAGYLVSGLDGLTTYTAVPGQLGFPTCLTALSWPTRTATSSDFTRPER